MMSRDGCGWCGPIWWWAIATRRKAPGSHHTQVRRARMTRRQRQLTMIRGSLAVLAVAAALVLNAMRDSIVFFSTPAMVAEKHIPAGRRFRLGGPVQPGALVRGDNLAVTFQ